MMTPATGLATTARGGQWRRHWILPALLLLALFSYAAMARDQESAPPVPQVMAEDLQALTATQRRVLAPELTARHFDGVLAAARVGEALGDDAGNGAAREALMLALLPAAQRFALPPISDFRVGAVVEGVSGALYFGANLEIPGEALAFAVHAEQSAINNALLHGEAGVRRLVVTASPCGHCRQFLNELDAATDLRIIVAGAAPASLGELLPQSFGPAQLGIEAGLMAAGVTPMQCPGAAVDARRLCRAEATHRHSYAPHSGSPSAVVLEAAGHLHAGAYVENAAFNPSLPPILSALDRMRFQNRDFASIEHVLLLEHADPRIRQGGYTRAVLARIAPAASLSEQAVGAARP